MRPWRLHIRVETMMYSQRTFPLSSRHSTGRRGVSLSFLAQLNTRQKNASCQSVQRRMHLLFTPFFLSGGWGEGGVSDPISS